MRSTIILSAMIATFVSQMVLATAALAGGSSPMSTKCPAGTTWKSGKCVKG